MLLFLRVHRRVGLTEQGVEVNRAMPFGQKSKTAAETLGIIRRRFAQMLLYGLDKSAQIAIAFVIVADGY